MNKDTQLNTKALRYVVKDYQKLAQEKLIEFAEKVLVDSGKIAALETFTKAVSDALQAFITARTAADVAKNTHNQDDKIIKHNHLNKALNNLADEINHISREIDFLSSTGFNLNNDSHSKKMPDLVQSIKLLDIMQAGAVKLKIIMPMHSHYTGFQVLVHCEDGSETIEISTRKILTLRGLQSGKSYTLKACAWTPLSQEQGDYNYCQPIKVVVQ